MLILFWRDNLLKNSVLEELLFFLIKFDDFNSWQVFCIRVNVV